MPFIAACRDSGMVTQLARGGSLYPMRCVGKVKRIVGKYVKFFCNDPTGGF
jgi:hypothetical protein